MTVISFPSDKYSEVKLLDHMVVVRLIFLGTSILFSIVAAQFTFSLTMHKCSLFCTSSQTFIISCLFDNSLSNRCEMIAHCGFDLHLLDD